MLLTVVGAWQMIRIGGTFLSVTRSACSVVASLKGLARAEMRCTVNLTSFEIQDIRVGAWEEEQQ
jgi:hypothetical protein